MLIQLSSFLAHLHPALVHLPIGILMLAVLMYWLSLTKKYAPLKAAVSFAFLAGAISAIASCFTGWLLSSGGEYDETTLSIHQWMGILVAFTSASGYFLSLQKNQGQLKIFSAIVLLLVTITGHFGGTLTHGEGYLTKAFTTTSKGLAFQKPIIPNAQDAIVYRDIIQPIFQQKCYNCHAATKQKAALRLDTEAWIIKGGKNGAVLHAGNADSSEIYKRVVLDPLEEKHMPPKGKPQLTEQERVFLQWWILTGADFKKQSKELAQTPQIKTALVSLEKPVTAITHLDIPEKTVSRASESVLDSLHKKGVTILPIALNSNYLSANFVNFTHWDAPTKNLIATVKEQLIWLKISGVQLNETEWSTIASLTSLTKLSAEHSNISDQNLIQIAALKNLRYLNLVDTKVTAKGLMQLKGTTCLANIYLGSTAISQLDYSKLKIAFPKVFIDTGGYKLEFIATDTQALHPPLIKK